jgi:hypothetical protein
MPPVNHSILGASSAERWMHCTPSARLTADMAEEESVYAAEGTAAHALAEWKVRKALKMQAGKRPSSDYWTDEMEETTDDYRDYIVDLVNEARKTCPDPVFSVEQRLDFSCYVPQGFGTGDFLLVYDGQLNIVDLKFGKGVPVSSDHNVQMMLYALGSLELYDMLYDVKDVTMTIFQPRLSNISVWSTTADELRKWATDELMPKAQMADKGEGDFVPGPWCRFCKARHQCRERAEHFHELTAMDFREPALLTDEEIAKVLQEADELKRWSEDVEAYATSAAINEGKHFTGFKLVEGRSNRKFTDTKAVEKAAIAAGYQDIYTKSLLTLTGFEKLMGKDFDTVLGKYVTKPAGKLTLVPESDKRPEAVTGKQNDFLD